MTRRFQGLNQTAPTVPGELPDGLYLVRVEKAQYRWHPHKPFYILRLSVLARIILEFERQQKPPLLQTC
jgi:hypothetical protein